MAAISQEEPKQTKRSSYSLFKEYTESTTVHGIRNVFGEYSKIRRVVWLLFLLCSTAFFLRSAIRTALSYYDVVTRITIANPHSTSFPAVTLCNFNYARSEYVLATNASKILSPELIFEGKLYEGEDVQFALNASHEDAVRDGAHRLNEMLVSCQFNGEECGYKDFKPVFTKMGQCYSFNTEPRNSSITTIPKPGREHGLTMDLSVEQEKYFGLASMEAGFKVHIHEPDEQPLVAEHGFAVMPGAATFVGITKKKIKSLPSPYPTNCENLEIPGMKTYTKPLCYEACKASYVIKSCGCRSAHVPNLTGIPVCSIRQMFKCTYPHEGLFNKHEMKNCHCPKPCERTLYETQLSYAQCPGEIARNALVPIILARMGLNETQVDAGGESVKEVAFRFIGWNFVRLNIYFRDLSYNIIEDIPKNDVESFLAGIGGMLGLFIGASVISVVEFFDFLYSLLVHKLVTKS